MRVSLVFVLAPAGGPTYAARYTVSPAGDDAMDGVAAPWKTPLALGLESRRRRRPSVR